MIFALISIVCNALAQVSLKQLTKNMSDNSNVLTDAYTYISFSLYAVSIATWVLALRKLEVSAAYPLQSLGYVIVFLLGYFLFDETLNIMKILGFLFIILGAIILSVSISR